MGNKTNYYPFLYFDYFQVYNPAFIYLRKSFKLIY